MLQLHQGLMDTTPVYNQLKNFIANQILFDQDEGLDASTPLLELGLIDSLTLLSLITFVEEHYSISIPIEKVVPKNFENLEVLTSMVAEVIAEQVQPK